MFNIVPIMEAYRKVVDDCIAESWGGPYIVTKGKIIDTRTNAGVVAIGDNGILGYALYNIADGECEITVLESLVENQGIGSALVEMIIKQASHEGCTRIWLITTNDNVRAIRFYQRIGFNLCAVHINALEESRKLKPKIPLTGYDGIPIAHEFEFEKKC